MPTTQDYANRLGVARVLTVPPTELRGTRITVVVGAKRVHFLTLGACYNEYGDVPNTARATLCQLFLGCRDRAGLDYPLWVGACEDKPLPVCATCFDISQALAAHHA